MTHILCVRLLNWPIDRLRRRERWREEGRRTQGRPPALVLIHTSGNRQHVTAVSPPAAGCGIRPGMTLAQARALRSDVIAREHDPGRDARSLEALGRWMMRFTPAVALVRPQDPETSECGLLLDITGCARLFGGYHVLARRVEAALQAMDLGARIAAAPTPGAAWALTFRPLVSAAGALVVPHQRLAEALAPLPPHVLRIEREMVESLHHLGIQAIEQLVRLPRAQLPARFGDQLLLRLDQAMGRIPEPLDLLPHRHPVRAGMDFEGPVESLEAIWHVFRHLAGDLIAQLARRGCGARRLDIILPLPDAPPLQRTILLSRPSRDPVNLFNLFRCALEGLESGRSLASNAPDGFAGLHLHVPLMEPISDEQIGLVERDAQVGQRELEQLIERLSVRLGQQAVAQAALIESYIPERSCALQACLAEAPAAAVAVRQTRLARSRSRRQPPDEKHPAPRLRPLRMLGQPLEIGVTVSPSHDRDGRPIQFRGRGGRLHRLVHAVGPERIAGQWWSGHHRTRDYFDVEDDCGRRFWIFRVQENGRWFVQGEYE